MPTDAKSDGHLGFTATHEYYTWSGGVLRIAEIRKAPRSSTVEETSEGSVRIVGSRFHAFAHPAWLEEVAKECGVEG